MSITARVILEARTIDALNLAIAASIALGNQPAGVPFSGDAGGTICQAMDTGTAVQLVGTAISGPTIDSAIIGGTTPAAGTFTNLTETGDLTLSAHDTLTAHAGGGRASAVALDKTINRISVCATAADSVVLPAATAGLTRVVDNDGAAAAQVFANGSDTIDGVAGATGVVLTNAKRAIYFAVAAATWISLMGVKSA